MEPIARESMQKQIAALGLAERYFDSVVFFALYELGVFGRLEAGPQSFEAIQSAIGGSVETLRALLDAGVALRILSKEGALYRASDDLLDCVARPNNPAFVGEWVDFLQAFVVPLLHMPEAVRTGKPPLDHVANFESGDTPEARRMTRAMDAYARSRGVEIAKRLSFEGVNTLLDLGCGPGTYAIAIMEKHPHVKATLLDLPGPIAEAKRLAHERGVTDRVTFVAEDGVNYRPEHPFDAVLISNVLNMLGPDKSRQMLKHCLGLVAPGGRILIQGQYLNDDRVSPRWPAIASLMQRAVSSEGRNHAVGETIEWLQEAGFERMEHVRFSLWNVCSCVIGYRAR
jgi:SAM-dependent methyltransferase